jgi:hypothetical protein
MAVTDLAAVTNQVQKFWSPLFSKELRKNSLLPSLVNKDYQGEIKNGGDTVYVSQINAPAGENLDVGTNADTFNPEQLSTSRISVVANKRAVASFEIQDLAQLQSQLESQDSEIRMALMYAVEQKINAYLYSLVNPSSSSPDHLINSVTDFNAAQLSANRMLAAQAKWERSKGWYILADPSYYSDMLNAQTLTSRDYTGQDDVPVIAGQIVNKRFGFNILEDNSLAVDQAVTFHPDFCHLVMQKEPSFKLSDLHSQKKFGYLLSVDVIYGAALGNSGNKKHILTTASASASSVVMA